MTPRSESTLADVFYRGHRVEPPSIVGVRIGHHFGAGLHKQAVQIASLAADLVVQGGVPSEEIAVLIVNHHHKESLFQILSQNPLPKSYEWLADVLPRPLCIRVDSVHRFKGLVINVNYFFRSR